MFCIYSFQPELEPTRYGLQISDKVNFKGILDIPGKPEGTVKDALEYLESIYTKTISAEFLYAEVKSSDL